MLLYPFLFWSGGGGVLKHVFFLFPFTFCAITKRDKRYMIIARVKRDGWVLYRVIETKRTDPRFVVHLQKKNVCNKFVMNSLF